MHQVGDAVSEQLSHRKRNSGSNHSWQLAWRFRMWLPWINMSLHLSQPSSCGETNLPLYTCNARFHSGLHQVINFSWPPRFASASFPDIYVVVCINSFQTRHRAYNMNPHLFIHRWHLTDFEASFLCHGKHAFCWWLLHKCITESDNLNVESLWLFRPRH